MRTCLRRFAHACTGFAPYVHTERTRNAVFYEVSFVNTGVTVWSRGKVRQPGKRNSTSWPSPICYSMRLRSDGVRMPSEFLSSLLKARGGFWSHSA